VTAPDGLIVIQVEIEIRCVSEDQVEEYRDAMDIDLEKLQREIEETGARITWTWK
jgi:hypothetical protein